MFVCGCSFGYISLPSTPGVFSLWTVIMLRPFVCRSRMIEYSFHCFRCTFNITFVTMNGFSIVFWNLSISTKVSLPRPPIVFPSESFFPLCTVTRLRSALPILFCMWPTHSFFFDFHTVPIWLGFHYSCMSGTITVTNKSSVAKAILEY